MKRCFRYVYLVVWGMVVCATMSNAQRSVQLLPIGASLRANHEFLNQDEWNRENIKDKELAAFAVKALEAYPGEWKGNTYVREAVVSDMTADGTNEIVLVLENEGTIGPVSLSVLYRIEGGLMLQNFITIGAGVKCFQDLNGDGVFEIIVQDGMDIGTSTNLGMILYPAVYAWDSSQWTEASQEYPEYYRSLLKETRADIAELQAMTPEERRDLNDIRPDRETEEIWERRHEDRIAAHQLREAKLLRVLGDKKTGLDRADEWSKSDSRKQKTFAFTILAEEDSTRATEILQRISEGPDQRYSDSAKEILKRRARKGNSATPSPTSNASQ